MIIAICKAAFKVERVFVKPKALYAAADLWRERQYCEYQDSGDTRLSTRWKPPVQRMKRCERSCITNASDFTVGNGSKQLRTSLFVLGDQDLITRWYNYTKSLESFYRHQF